MFDGPYTISSYLVSIMKIGMKYRSIFLLPCLDDLISGEVAIPKVHTVTTCVVIIVIHSNAVNLYLE